jgi:hypothetical protein
VVPVLQPATQQEQQARFSPVGLTTSTSTNVCTHGSPLRLPAGCWLASKPWPPQDWCQASTSGCSSSNNPANGCTNLNRAHLLVERSDDARALVLADEQALGSVLLTQRCHRHRSEAIASTVDMHVPYGRGIHTSCHNSAIAMTDRCKCSVSIHRHQYPGKTATRQLSIPAGNVIVVGATWEASQPV